MTRIKINISGEIYETFDSTLQRFPDTLLGNTSKREIYFCFHSQELFFNRNRSSFNAILYFYQSFGMLSCPLDTPLHIFEEECRFFEINESSILEMKLKNGYLNLDGDYFDNTINRTRKERLWDFLDNPETSKYATWFAIISLLAILISIVSTCVETVPVIYGDPASKQRMFWKRLELALNTWFLIELILRFLSSPNKISFIKQWLAVVDVVAVCPYFLLFFMDSDTASLGFLKILRFARIIRLFRLSKHSKRIKVAGKIIASSFDELQLLFVCLMISNVFGGSIMYFIEGTDGETQFKSIPEGIWWGVQTVVTLGYGDVVPVTILGKFLASGYMVFGALTICLPVLSIVVKFTHMYEINVLESEA